jgi:hypothetical protein
MTRATCECSDELETPLTGAWRRELPVAVDVLMQRPPRATLIVWAPRQTPSTGISAASAARHTASSKASSVGSVGPSWTWRSRAP